MSSDKEKRLDGVFRLMKVPGFEEPQPPTADPRSISPMVVERDPVTSRITRAELEPHDTAETAKLLFKYLQDQSAAEAAERNAAAASSAGRPVDTPLLPKGPSDNKQESIVPTNIQPTDKPSIWLSQAIKEYIELARNQQELSANTITYTHDPSLRLFRELISEKRRVFGHPDTMGKWDIRLDEITPEKMDAFIAAFWSFPSRQGKRPKDADAKELAALGGTPQSHTNTISRLKHIAKLLSSLVKRRELDASVLGVLQAALIGTSSQRDRSEPLPLDLGEHAEDGYVAFSREDLLRLFHPVVYAAHSAGDAPRYWIPLLGRLTGCRLNEIAQANVLDIRIYDGIPCLFVTSIDRKADGKVLPVEKRLIGVKRLKTKAGRRAIPLHPELIRLGFLEYVRQRISEDSHSLFDLQWMPKDGFGKYPGRDFRNMSEAVGFWEKKRKVFHSFRSTISQQLEDAELEDSLIDRFLGHSINTVRQEHYNRNRADRTMPLRRVYEALCKVAVEPGIPKWSEVREAQRKQLKGICSKLGFAATSPNASLFGLTE